MKKTISIEDLRNSKCAALNPQLFEQPKKEKKKSKYGNSKTEVDGIIIDSKREAKRWKELRLMLKKGIIGMLARQVEFELNPGGTHSLIYKADATYMIMETGERVVEDAKGIRTKEYLKKKSLMQKVHGIKISEV